MAAALQFEHGSQWSSGKNAGFIRFLHCNVGSSLAFVGSSVFVLYIIVLVVRVPLLPGWSLLSLSISDGLAIKWNNAHYFYYYQKQPWVPGTDTTGGSLHNVLSTIALRDISH